MLQHGTGYYLTTGLEVRLDDYYGMDNNRLGVLDYYSGSTNKKRK